MWIHCTDACRSRHGGHAPQLAHRGRARLAGAGAGAAPAAAAAKVADWAAAVRPARLLPHFPHFLEKKLMMFFWPAGGAALPPFLDPPAVQMRCG